MGRARAPSFLRPLILFHSVNDGVLAALSAIYPLLAQTDGFDLTYKDIGLLTSLGLTVTIIFQIIAGRLGDIKNPQHLMAGGILIVGISSILLTQSYNMITLLAFSLMLRMGTSFYHPIGIGWISRKFKGGALDRSMGYQSAFGDAGVLISFLTTGYIAMVWGWKIPFIIWGVANIVAVIIGMAQRYDVKVPGPKPALVNGQGPKGHGLLAMSRLFKSFKFSLVPLAVTGAAYTITSTFGPLLITDPDVIGGSPAVAGQVVAIWIGAGVVSATFYGKISSYLGRRRSLLISFVMISITSAIIGLSKDLLVICLMMAVYGFFLFLTWPGLFAMISEATGKISQGLIFGIIFAGQIMGGASIAYFAGLSAEAYGIGTPFLILSVMVLMPIVTLLLHKGSPGNVCE